MHNMTPMTPTVFANASASASAISTCVLGRSGNDMSHFYHTIDICVVGCFLDLVSDQPR